MGEQRALASGAGSPTSSPSGSRPASSSAATAGCPAGRRPRDHPPRRMTLFHPCDPSQKPESQPPSERFAPFIPLIPRGRQPDHLPEINHRHESGIGAHLSDPEPLSSLSSRPAGANYVTGAAYRGAVQVLPDLLAPCGHPRPLTCAIACNSLRNSAAVRGAWRDER
jgi:hypothetical protein